MKPLLPRLLGGVLLASALGACMPAYRQPPALAQVTVPARWSEAAPGGHPIEPAWWRGFGDSDLNQLVQAALARNTDLLLALARVDEARALAQAAGAGGQPVLNAALGAQVTHAPGVAGLATTRALQPELQASWELDLWGRLRQQARGAGLRYQASRAERDGVALAVAAATTQAYVTLLALDAQLEISKATAASRAEALRLAGDQSRLGYTSQLQLSQAESEYEAVLQVIPQLELAIRRQQNALRLLAGELPGALPRDHRFDHRFDQLKTAALPSSLPSELLVRRPDIVQGELLLAASDANLAARRAEFLPQVALSAKLGSLLSGSLGSDAVTVWSLGGSVLAPLFSAGRLHAQADAAAAQRDQAAFAYRRTVLSAFGEVDNALAALGRLQARMEHIARRRTVLVRTLGFARDRYQAGYAAYLEVLDAQRNLYQTELDAVTQRQDQLNNLVALYRALGGGWAAPSALSDEPAGTGQRAR